MIVTTLHPQIYLSLAKEETGLQDGKHYIHLMMLLPEPVKNPEIPTIGPRRAARLADVFIRLDPDAPVPVVVVHPDCEGCATAYTKDELPLLQHYMRSDASDPENPPSNGNPHGAGEEPCESS